MQTFALIFGIVFLVLGVIISIALHELGHLLPAKKFSCLVSEYMVGFGPTIYLGKKSRRIRAEQEAQKALETSSPETVRPLTAPETATKVKETELATIYGIKAILLGGYCKILGMYRPPSSAAEMAENYRRGISGEKEKKKSSLSEEAREAEYEQLLQYTRGDQRLFGRAFYRLSTGKKLVVMLGGITMNLFLAAFFLLLSMSVIGGIAPSTTLAEVSCGSQSQVHACADAEITAGHSENLSPAAQAGLRAGDQILSWNGQKVSSWTELTQQIAIQKQQGTTAVVEIERAGQTQTLTMPAITDKAGIVSQMQWQRASLLETAQAYGQLFTGTVKVVFRLPQAVWSVGTELFSGSKRSADGVMSIVGVGRLAGEIAAAPNPEFSFLARIGVLFSLLASLNMALAVFNLIPLPPLDGGHVLVALWQGLRNTWARLRRQPLPEPCDASGLVPLTYVVAVLLIAMSIFLIGADIISPVKLG